MSARTKRREPWRPSQPIKAAGDTRSFAVPASRVVPVLVDDPYADGKIVALRSGRDDPLGWLHAHRQIDDQQYPAGRLYERDVEVSEGGGLRGIDPTKERVDGGRPPELPIDAIQDARKSRQRAEAAMGLIGAEIAYDHLVEGLSFGQIALKRAGLYYDDDAKCKGGPLSGAYDDPLELQTQRANQRARIILGQRRVNDYGVLFRAGLDCLVIHYGLPTRLAA
jgi:hypothetical protein